MLEHKQVLPRGSKMQAVEMQSRALLHVTSTAQGEAVCKCYNPARYATKAVAVAAIWLVDQALDPSSCRMSDELRCSGESNCISGMKGSRTLML